MQGEAQNTKKQRRSDQLRRRGAEGEARAWVSEAARDAGKMGSCRASDGLLGLPGAGTNDEDSHSRRGTRQTFLGLSRTEAHTIVTSLHQPQARSSTCPTAGRCILASKDPIVSPGPHCLPPTPALPPTEQQGKWVQGKPANRPQPPPGKPFVILSLLSTSCFSRPRSQSGLPLKPPHTPTVPLSRAFGGIWSPWLRSGWGGGCHPAGVSPASYLPCEQAARTPVFSASLYLRSTCPTHGTSSVNAPRTKTLGIHPKQSLKILPVSGTRECSNPALQRTPLQSFNFFLSP